MPTGNVRRAGLADITPLSGAIARAFYDDPVLSWTFPDDRQRLAQAEAFFALRLRGMIPDGEVYTAEDLSAGALWAPPDRWKVGVLDSLRLVRLLPWRGLGQTIRGFTAIEAAHPKTPPHYYLAVLGTEPAAQGQGLGSALLGPVLADCDELGIGAYLESSKESNIAFYARHGFRVTGEVDLPNGPRVWLMWRDPV